LGGFLLLAGAASRALDRRRGSDVVGTTIKYSLALNIPTSPLHQLLALSRLHGGQERLDSKYSMKLPPFMRKQMFAKFDLNNGVSPSSINRQLSARRDIRLRD